MLRAEQVSKTYDQRPVLNIPALYLEPGLFWLQGENGSGKSTFLRMLAGLIPFEGRIILQDVDLKASPRAYRSLVGFAEAEPLYPDFLTGQELIRFFEKIRGRGIGYNEILVRELHMEKFIHEPTGTYSSGMLKKLSLILAFTGNPSLILLDEPLATLDEASIGTLPSVISRCQEEHQTSFVFSSHQLFPLQSGKVRPLLLTGQNITRL